MSDSFDQALANAFDLIEGDQLAEAEALLKPILEQDENNVDAWWLYAHAVSDPETARMALNQVLKLDESYTEASDMLAELDTYLPSSDFVPPTPPSMLPESEVDSETAEAAFDDLEDDEALFSLADDDEPVFGDRESADNMTAGAERSNLPVFLIVFLIIVVLVAVVLILNPFSNNATPTPTSVAQQVESAATSDSTTESATDEPTVSEQQLPTDLATTASTPQQETTEPVTATAVEIEPAGSDLTGIVSEVLASFELAPDSIGVVQTSLNNTLVAGVCSNSSRAQLQETLDGSLVKLASLVDTLADDIDAIGVALVDCDNENQVIRVIGVSVNDAVRFSSGDLDETQFRSLWQAIA